MQHCAWLAIFVHDHSPTREPMRLRSHNLLLDRLATPQDTQSRKQRFFCATAKYTGFGCAREENNTDTVTGRSPEQPTARIYSNDRNCHSSLDPCASRTCKLSSGFSPSLVSCSTVRILRQHCQGEGHSAGSRQQDHYLGPH